MGLWERLRWFGKLALLLFILASVAFLSAITAMRFAIQGREVRVPDVVGKKVQDGQAALRATGLGMKVEDRIYSDKPVDTVVRQSPSAGMPVKVGQRAHVVLSMGPQRVTIPSLTEKSLRAARIELLRGSLQIGEISSAYLPAFPADTVVQQNPPPGTPDATGPRVDLLASLGARPVAYVMPELVGLAFAEAQQQVLAAGLKLSKISFRITPGATHATVTSQSPLSGSRIDAGGSVELEVAE